MKYLAAYLEAAKSEDVRNRLPTEPTKPPSTSLEEGRNSVGRMGRGTYKTYETSVAPPRVEFGRSDWAYLSILRWGPALGDPEPGLDVEPPF
jgi:hypothetical protein